MTSQSKPGRVEQRVVTDLDKLNEGLPQSIQDDIARVRQRALTQAREARRHSQISWLRTVKQYARHWRLQFVAPVAVAVLLSVRVSYDPQSGVPALPVTLLADDVPAEDLAMLEDLEFASWLAEQENEVVL